MFDSNCLYFSTIIFLIYLYQIPYPIVASTAMDKQNLDHNYLYNCLQAMVLMVLVKDMVLVPLDNCYLIVLLIVIHGIYSILPSYNAVLQMDIRGSSQKVSFCALILVLDLFEGEVEIVV